MTMIIDCETEPFGPGRQLPPVVATVWRRGENQGITLGCEPLPEEVTGFAVDYDLGCYVGAGHSSVWDLYEGDRVVDLRIRCQLRDIASRGDLRPVPYSLDGEAQHVGLTPHECKSSPWRTRYAELRGTSPEGWPEEARAYILEDLRLTAGLAERVPPQVDERPQARYAFALRLVSSWGLRVDADAVAGLSSRIDEVINRHRAVLTREGLLKKNGSRDMKAIRELARREGLKKQTPSGKISVGAKALRDATHPALQALATYQQALAVRDRELVLLRQSPVIHTRFDLAATGRSTSRSPNLQNLSKAWGVRDCFRPREGHVYLVVDYPALELRTLAQCIATLLGKPDNDLTRALSRPDADPHLEFAVDELGAPRGLPKDHPEVAKLRQLAKAANFGLPGGMAGPSFAEYARASYGVEVTDPDGVRAAWLRKWRDVGPYLQRQRQLSRAGIPIRHVGSGRVRGRCTPTQASNSPFQALGADVAKDTLWALVRECYVGGLRPCRVVAFVHDEYVIECPKEMAERMAPVVEAVIQDRWPRWCPDVALGPLEIKTSERWVK